MALLFGLGVSSLATPASIAAQAVEGAVAFDDAGRLKEITPGIADRLGLRPPTWPVEGEYRRALLVRDANGAHALVVQRFDGTTDRAPLTDDQVAAIRLEVTARAGVLARSTGRPLESPPPLAAAVPSSGTEPPAARPALLRPNEPATPISRRAFVFRETLLGATVFGVSSWMAVDSKAFSPSAYLFTAAGSFLLATNAINQRPFTEPQSNLGVLAALAGTFGGSAMANALGVDGRQQRAVAALVGGVGANVGALLWARDASGAEARGATYGALGAGALVAGALGASGAFEIPSAVSPRLSAGLVTAAVFAGAPLGRAYVRSARYRVTDGDVGSLTTAAGLGAVLGLGAAGGSAASERTRWGAASAGAALGLVAGDLLLVRPYDHDASDVGALWVGAGLGAAIAALPYRLAGETRSGPTLVLAGLGGIAGVWGAEIVSRPRAGQRLAARGGAQQTGRLGARLTVDWRSALFAASRVPGNFGIARLTF